MLWMRPTTSCWRKGLGTTYTQADYDVWRAHFGQTAGSGSGASANAAVPEPATLMLLMLFAASCSCSATPGRVEIPETQLRVTLVINRPLRHGRPTTIMSARATATDAFARHFKTCRCGSYLAQVYSAENSYVFSE